MINPKYIELINKDIDHTITNSEKKELQEYLEKNEFVNNDDDRFDDDQVQIYQKLFGFNLFRNSYQNSSSGFTQT